MSKKPITRGKARKPTKASVKAAADRAEAHAAGKTVESAASASAPCLPLTCESVACVMDGCQTRRFGADTAPIFMARKFGVDLDTFERFVDQNADAIIDELEELQAPRSARNSHRRERSKVDTAFRVANNMRARFAISLKGGVKPGSTFKLFGYTAQDVIDHLTPMLRPGMSWDNYGAVWHIDHKRPIASFDFTRNTKDVVRECWALSNLQPLFADENISKGAKWLS